jgi:hypothetical protein
MEERHGSASDRGTKTKANLMVNSRPASLFVPKRVKS